MPVRLSSYVSLPLALEGQNGLSQDQRSQRSDTVTALGSHHDVGSTIVGVIKFSHPKFPTHTTATSRRQRKKWRLSTPIF
jgi:hypothetical protein